MSTVYDIFRNGAVPPGEASVISLAFVGDTLCDLYLRTALLSRQDLSPHEMHTEASRVAKAASQAKMAQNLLDVLSEEEERILKRARNHHSISVPKNASPVDYKWATGFEALLGWLYLNGRDERVAELMKLGIETLENKGEVQ